MTTPSNPYVVGPAVTGPIFHGRRDILAFVQESLIAPQQNAVVLYGQRRMGKTSILKELPNRLPASEFHTVFFDLQGQAANSLGEVLYHLAREVASSLKLPDPSPEPFRTEGDYFQKSFLPQMYDRLGKRRLLLLFDEFDVLSDEKKSRLASAAVDALFPFLRSLLDTEKKRLSFVFVVGRQLDQLPHWTLRIFKDARYKAVSLLDRRDAQALIADPVKGVLRYGPDAIEEILKLTSCHPYFTQLMCYEIFNAKKKRALPVTASEARAAIPLALETGVAAFDWIWEGLDHNSQLLLSAIAEATANGKKADAEVMQQALSKNRVRLSTLEWQDTLKILVEWGILKRDETNRVSFVVELVRLWVLKSKPLRDIKSQLTRALASRLEMAEEAYHGKKYGEAIELYREVLKHNPNHPGAQLGLATALQEQGKLPEAVAAFEEAYWLDELHSRDGLVKIRLDQGEQLERAGKHEEAGLQFKRVLELDSGNPKVLDRLKMLYDQGQTTLRTDQLDQAIEYFERVILCKEDYQNVKALLKKARAKRDRLRGKGTPFSLGALLIRVSVAAALLLALGGAGYFAYNRYFTLPTPTVSMTVGNTATSAPVGTATQTPTPVVVVVTATPTASPTPGPTATPTPTPTPTITPTPPDTPTPIIIVVTATSTPTPSPTPTSTPTPTPSPTASPTPVFKYDAPTLISPPNGAAFHGQNALIEIRWEGVPAGLAEDEFYGVSFRYLQNGKVQYSGTDTKETSWQPQGILFYLKADRPERRYEWDVKIVRVSIDAQGQKTSIPLSPTSETRFFTWGD